MIQVMLEMNDRGQVGVVSKAPPPICLAIITAAYHEMLSKKIQDDIKEAAEEAAKVKPYAADVMNMVRRVVKP